MNLRALPLSLVLLAFVAPDAAATTTTKVSANGDRLTTHEVTQGRFFVQTPDAWQRRGRDGLRTAIFRVHPEAGCAVEVVVSLRGIATRTGPRTQVRVATRGGDPIFGEGDGRAGPWRVARIPSGTLYGIASQRIALRRYAQVRALGLTEGTCTDAALRQIADHLVRLVRTARVEVNVQRI